MIRLPYTGTYSLELVTAQNGAEVVVCYSDATATAYTGGTQATTITSATTTTIGSTPAAATVRDVDEINIKNTYAGSHTVTVQLDVNATNYPIITAALAENESLNYTHGSGWQCKDVNGNTKSGVLSSMTSAQLAAIISDESGTGALVFANSPTLVTPALGTPASGDLRNCSMAVAPAIGGTTPGSGAFTTLSSAESAPSAYKNVDFSNSAATGYVAMRLFANAASVQYIAQVNWAPGIFMQYVSPDATPHVFSVNSANIATISATGLAAIGVISATTTILSSGATSGVGYTTGAGGTVTQATDRTTGVTINKVSGAITLVSAAGTTSWQSFTVTNSAVAATDTIVVNQKSGTDLNMIHVTAVAAGSFVISFATTGGTTTEQPVFNFNVIKGVAA